MKWNHRFIVCGSSVALFAFAGCCKKIIRITADQTLAPITASPGETLEWIAGQPGETLDVYWQSGLCQNSTSNPIPASYGKPAKCTVATQNYGSGNQSNTYTYSFEGNVKGRRYHSPEYKMAVGPRGCTHC